MEVTNCRNVAEGNCIRLGRIEFKSCELLVEKRITLRLVTLTGELRMANSPVIDPLTLRLSSGSNPEREFEHVESGVEGFDSLRIDQAH